jgi:CHAD domain-containing protein
MADYFSRSRRLLAGEPSPAELHRLRLWTKRLRYTLELFRSCYGPGLETRLKELRSIQQLLGEINDCVAGAGLLERAMDGSRDKNRVRQFLDSKASGKAAEFRKHWTGAFDAPGREAWWCEYLASPSSRARRRT